jgi:hypothetical protein
MVHGNYYGAQYEIYINKSIDFYNDILPICMSVREKIELVNFDEQYKSKIKRLNFGNGKCKLIIIPYKKLFNRFEKLKYAEIYFHLNDKMTYDELNMNRFNRENNFEEFKYLDVKIYKNLIKHNKSLPKPVTSEELESLEESYKNIFIKMYKNEDYWHSEEKTQIELDRVIHESLLNQLNIQRIITRPEYFEEIINIEKSLTNIELTDREKELINSVINHPNLKDLIEFHGINLIEGYY